MLERNVPIINDKKFNRCAEGKLMADCSPQWSTLIEQKPKLYYYKQIKNEYKAKNYCYINLKRFQRSLLAKFRLGMFPINIELGRYQRFCPLCDLDQVEDELHILFDCPRYCELCKPLFEQAALTDALFNDVSNIDKMKILTNNYHIVRKTATFLHQVLIYYNNTQSKRYNIINIIIFNSKSSYN